MEKLIYTKLQLLFEAMLIETEKEKLNEILESIVNNEISVPEKIDEIMNIIK